MVISVNAFSGVEMEPEYAEKIIREYGGVVADIKDGDTVQDVFSLPYSPGKIRYAIFAYTEALIENGLFTDEIKDQLAQLYALLDTRFVEDSEGINIAIKMYAKGDEKATKILKQFGGLVAFMPSTEKMIEYHNFVVDCYGNWGKDSSN